MTLEPIMTLNTPKARTAAQKDLDSTVAWLRDHKGDVNHSAFVDACDRVARLACREAGLRYPDSLGGLGYRTLDIAAVLLKTYIPGDAMFHTLPGYFGAESESV